MHTRSRLLLLIVPAIALALGACDPNGGSPSPAATVAQVSPSASPTATPVSSPDQSAAATVEPTTSPQPAVGQTDTGWGRIWDALPSGFPRYPGATTADDAAAEPASGTYALPDGDPAEIASWLQTGLETATYSTEALSGPLEDGSYVLDSVGEPGCRIRTTVAPLGSLIMVTVLYGAACPA
jgi:hypothetical protein